MSRYRVQIWLVGLGCLIMYSALWAAPKGRGPKARGEALEPPAARKGAAAQKVGQGSASAPKPESAQPDRAAGLLAPPKPSGKVVAVTLRGDPATWAKALDSALDGLSAKDLLIVRMRSLGGRLQASRAASKKLAGAACRTLVFADGPVLGTSLLVALSAEVLVMAPDARIGGADPAQFQAGSLSSAERGKLLSDLRSLAEKHHKPFGPMSAMVDAKAKLDLDQKPLSVSARGGVKGADEGEFLCLGAKAARELGLADAIASSLDEIRGLVGVADRDMVLDGKIYGPLLHEQAAWGRLSRPKPVDPVKLVAGATKVYVVPIHGTIDLGLAPFVKRVLKGLGPHDVVILDIDTFGGRVDAAVKIRDALLSTKAKTIAFVNRRAISAGALISLACDLIVMTPGASMGAATPVQISGGKMKPTDEKVVSYMRKEMKSTAEAKGRRGDIAEAMVDREAEVTDVPDVFLKKISGLRKGKLLTMTTEEALKLGMADLQAADLADLRRQIGIQDVAMLRPKVNWAEKVSRFLTGPIVAGLLLTIGMLGLLIELYTPGIGVAGILGLICLVLFFFGHMIADLAGWGHVLLFMAGVVLLGLEIFVIPGFGIAGISGLTLILVSLVLALSGMHSVPFRVAWSLGYMSRALAMVFGSIAFTAVLGFLAIKYMPRSRLFSPMFLQTESARLKGGTGRGAGSPGPGGSGRSDSLAGELPERGARGLALTVLRPAGKVRFSGKTFSAVAEGDLVTKGTEVEVVRHQAGRVVVRPLVGDHQGSDQREDEKEV